MRRACLKRVLGFISLAILFWPAGVTKAINTELGGQPLSFMGIIKQGIAYGLSGDQYDTKEGVQSLLTQIILEGKYDPNPNLSIYASGKFNADQAYPVFSDNNEWREKRFHRSRDRLYILDDWQDLLGEAHVTWKANDFFFRVGKQIVGWGETDGFRLMDQINPLDQRRGITDVEYENSIIPVWLVRAEYRPPARPDWLQDLNFQFVFNPNPKFRGNETIQPGNDYAGIWAPMVKIPLGGPYPFDFAHLGSLDASIDRPGNWSTRGFEYAGRISATVCDARVTLNGFYGRDNDFVTRNLPVAPRVEVSPFDQRLIIHPAVEGFYPYFKFAGATFTKDLTFLQASALGSVSPVIRLETFYAFDSTFTNALNEFVKKDEFRGAAGVDWKVKIPFLNPRAYFFISPQVYLRRIIDYPSREERIPGIYENNWTTTLAVSTSYMHTKLQPSFFWLRDWTNRSQFFRYQVAWEHSSSIKFILGALIVTGTKEGAGLQPLIHKDHAYFNIAYKF